MKTKGENKQMATSLEALTMAMLREIVKGNAIPFATDDGQWAYDFDSERSVGTLAYYTQQCEFLGEQNPLPFMRSYEGFDSEKPCFSFLSPTGFTYQFNISL